MKPEAAQKNQAIVKKIIVERFFSKINAFSDTDNRLHGASPDTIDEAGFSQGIACPCTRRKLNTLCPQFPATSSR